LFEECLALFYCEKAVDIFHGITKNKKYTQSEINQLSELLEKSLLIYSQVLHDRDKFCCEVPSFDFKDYETKCTLVRKSLEKCLQDIETRCSESFELGSPQISPSSPCPILVLPSVSTFNPNDIQKRALSNISTFGVFGENLKLTYLLSWVKMVLETYTSTRDTSFHAQLILKRVETFVFSQFDFLFEMGGGGEGGGGARIGRVA
jgi:hypothetical protein